jgi:hypothetical protein
MMNEWLGEIDWKDRFAFECCDVRLGIRTDIAGLESKLKNILPFACRLCSDYDVSGELSLVVNQGEEKNGFYFNDELAMEIKEFDDSLLEPIGDKILVVLAQTSLPEKFYLHAGGVAWNDFGILLPGMSFAGKTTLTRELIKAGADYLSDDCVVLDNQGYLHPFPRDLAIRTDSGERILRNAEHFGSKTAEKKVKLKLILFTEFEENAEWKPEPVSRGKGVLELMDNFYFRPSVGLMPGEIIKSLVALTSDVEMYKGKRSEAGTVVDWIKNYLSKSTVNDRSRIAEAKTK